MERTLCCPRCWRTVSEDDATCPSCGAEERWIRGPLAGRTLAGGKYRLLEPLGSGGFGCTAKALQLFDGQSLGSVAVKFPLHADVAVTPREFIAEAMAMRCSPHQNVVVLHDAFVEESVPYLVMEHVDGPTLSRGVGSLSFEEKLYVGLQIADGADDFHAKGVVHCDLKPDNIALLPWLDWKPTFVKILDFGVACTWSGRRGWRDGWSGTPGFCPPEQVTGGPSPLSDVFALGVILFWMFTGALPFAPGLAAAPDLFFRQEVPPLPDDLPGEVVRLVRRCLSPDPDKRYPRMPTEPLRGFLNGGTGPVRTAPPDQKTLLATAKDLFIEAGLASSEEERTTLYRRSSELFTQAEAMGPLPGGLVGLAKNARRYSRLS